MGDKNSDQSIMDKSMRSVFVGNIPYEATEEKLKDIFCEVGPVISLKLVFDRESGKPKGYGFCEYKDQETALSAMRNLNGYEIGGRQLRVDNACTEKSRMEMAALLQGPQVENPYGEACDPDQAPEIITKTVASLPPEQMFELMKQMKNCMTNNPAEARQMLLQNPQLAYALLQAMVVMKILDPGTAVTYLQRGHQLPPILSSSGVEIPSQQVTAPVPAPVPAAFPLGHDVDLRDPRIPTRMPPAATVASLGDQDMRMAPGPMDFNRPAPTRANFDPRGDPRTRHVDPRTLDPRQNRAPTASQLNRIQGGGISADASEQEKAQLIMQVLALSDEQIAMLPPEQRNSILVLKDQLAKSAGR